MDWNNYLHNENEKPLDTLVGAYSYTSIFHKIAFIGDSLSSGEFETCDNEGNHGLYMMFPYSWGQYIARKNGIKAYNFSKGGMTARVYMELFGDMENLWDKEKACQAYVIAFGVNDIINNGWEIGSIDDVDKDNYKNNKPTFAGYYASIISRYKEISPDAKFFFVTFPNDVMFDKKDKRKEVLQSIKVLYDLAETFENSYVIDLYKYGPVYDEKFREKYFLHGHMNAMGYIFTANIIDSYIDYIIRHNPKDFENVPFIGTDIKYKF